MILALNLFETRAESMNYLAGKLKVSDAIERWAENYRPLGACSAYIWNDIRNNHRRRYRGDAGIRRDCPGAPDREPGHGHRQVPGQGQDHLSAVDLLGEESIQRLLHITDTNNPYRFDLRRGALARVAGGGIHFSDEIYKNKKDLVQVYLGVIQNRTIEIDGYKWPIDTLIIATSNNSEFNRFLAEKEEAPIVDRCRICYVSHNTNYKPAGAS
jgi:serine protein kinase